MNHTHNFACPDGFEVEGDDIDRPLINRYLGAIIDSCDDCHTAALAEIITAPATFAGLVRMSVTGYRTVSRNPTGFPLADSDMFADLIGNVFDLDPAELHALISSSSIEDRTLIAGYSTGALLAAATIAAGQT